MKLGVITEGLKELLLDNNYNPVTIRFYEREWKKIGSFLEEEYKDTEFDMERGLRYLEHQYGFISNCKNVMREANNVLDFLKAEDYIRFDVNGSAATQELYAAYKDWSEDMGTDVEIIRTSVHVYRACGTEVHMYR